MAINTTLIESMGTVIKVDANIAAENLNFFFSLVAKLRESSKAILSVREDSIMKHFHFVE